MRLPLHYKVSLPLFSVAALGLGLQATPTFAQGQANKPAVVVVIDASRSMWAQIEGINKIVSARAAIADMARRNESRLRLGLLAYGHRQSAGCKDIQLVLPPQSRPAKEMISAVNEIKPQGSTPIGEALLAAGKAIGAGSDKSAIVLISDGPDNCRGSPCEAAKTLKQQMPNLAIHVLAFDKAGQEELKALRCVAENTGGTFTPATNEAELITALNAAVETLVASPPTAKVVAPPTTTPQQVGKDTTVAQRQAPQGQIALAQQPQLQLTPPVQMPPPPAPPLAQQPPPPPAGKSDKAGDIRGAPLPVTLIAKLLEGSPNLRTGLIWRVFDATPGRDGAYKLVSTHRDAVPTASLAPGDYLINASYGLSNLTRRITVQPGKSAEEIFVLNAGGLRLASVLANGESIPPNSVRYDIYADETDQFGNRAKILSDAKPGLVIRLNAGAYHVVSVYGDANAIVRADVTVEPGRLTEAKVNHQAAKVTFRLVQQPGGEALADTRWSVLTPGGDVVKESAGALPTHILAAGTYTVMARHDNQSYSRQFTVGIGETKQIEVVMR